jgi:hypothetical protein
MSGKEQRKFHGTHRIQRRPRDWVRCLREGWLERDQCGLRRQRTAFEGVR